MERRYGMPILNPYDFRIYGWVESHDVVFIHRGDRTNYRDFLKVIFLDKPPKEFDWRKEGF
jgi:hypothetical protein